MRLGCSYTLAIVNSAAVNILVQDLLQHLFLIPLGIYTKSGIWGTLSNSTRNFLGKCFPQWLPASRGCDSGPTGPPGARGSLQVLGFQLFWNNVPDKRICSSGRVFDSSFLPSSLFFTSFAYWFEFLYKKNWYFLSPKVLPDPSRLLKKQ